MRVKLSKAVLTHAQARPSRYLLHDTRSVGLALKVEPSGSRTLVFRVSRPGRPTQRYNIGRYGEPWTLDPARAEDAARFQPGALGGAVPPFTASSGGVTRTGGGMALMEWHEAVEQVRPLVVKISTPSGSGTGFVFTPPLAGASVCAVATAAHVIDHAHAWEQPIRLLHPESGKSILTRPQNRSILINEDLDSAALVIHRDLLPLPATVPALSPVGMYLKVGNEAGWMGFPAVSDENLCFFSGRISCWLDQGAYLVDGVAINGVSGGPAFSLNHTGGVTIVGLVSAYIPNRATGEALPGVCVMRDVRQLQSIVATFGSFAQAKASETPPSELQPVDVKESDS